MWSPLAKRLAADHTVVVPDLRGMGLSSHPEEGYDKKSEAKDVAAVLQTLGLDGQLAWSRTISATWSDTPLPPRIVSGSRAGSVMDAPLPGLGHWDDVVKDQRTWHFDFFGPDEERLWLRAVSVFTSIASIMSCRLTHKARR